jgi:hypothetical protein
MLGNYEKIFVISMGNHLQSCMEDVDRLRNLLNGDKVIFVSKFNCNPQEEILNFLKNNIISSKDLLIVHYSGHGRLLGKIINGKMEMISTWLCGNMKSYNYSYDIDLILSNLTCKILLISDSCHSGRFGDFYTGNNLIFIGASSITNQSKEYSFNNKNKSGIIINILETINLDKLDPLTLQKHIQEFCKKHNMKIQPVFKEISNDGFRN